MMISLYVVGIFSIAGEDPAILTIESQIDHELITRGFLNLEIDLSVVAVLAI